VSWVLLIDPPASGAWNMALDAALLEAADLEGLKVLRLYAWNPGTLSFGRNEPALRRYDRHAIATRGLATVRRPTGGRAVWHHHELTYAVAAPASTFGSLQDTYLEIHAMLAAALSTLGAKVRLAGDRPAAAIGAGACFASPAGGEVLDPAGRKIVGSAQMRSGSAFLQHGSILLRADQHIVASLTIGDADPPSEAGLEEIVAAPNATWEVLRDAIARTASTRWHLAAPEGAPDEVLHRAEALRAHYADETWTWRR
jgi:lipoate-protein ligase A